MKLFKSGRLFELLVIIDEMELIINEAMCAHHSSLPAGPQITSLKEAEVIQPAIHAFNHNDHCRIRFPIRISVDLPYTSS